MTLAARAVLLVAAGLIFYPAAGTGLAGLPVHPLAFVGLAVFGVTAWWIGRRRSAAK